MPSSQDVLPSASMLTWIGGKKIGCRDLLIVLPTLFPSAACSWTVAHTLPPGRSVLVFFLRCDRGVGVWKRCELPCCYQGKGGRFCLREEMFFPVPLTGSD